MIPMDIFFLCLDCGEYTNKHINFQVHQTSQSLVMILRFQLFLFNSKLLKYDAYGHIFFVSWLWWVYKQAHKFLSPSDKSIFSYDFEISIIFIKFTTFRKRRPMDIFFLCLDCDEYIIKHTNFQVHQTSQSITGLFHFKIRISKLNSKLLKYDAYGHIFFELWIQ